MKDNCSTRGRDEKCLKSVGKNLKGKDRSEDLATDWK